MACKIEEKKQKVSHVKPNNVQTVYMCITATNLFVPFDLSFVLGLKNW